MTQSGTDATTPKYLRNKYAIVGVGETSYRRGSQESTRNLATWAINNALDKDAELSANLGWAMPGTGSAMVMQRG